VWCTLTSLERDEHDAAAFQLLGNQLHVDPVLREHDDLGHFCEHMQCRARACIIPMTLMRGESVLEEHEDLGCKRVCCPARIQD